MIMRVIDAGHNRSKLVIRMICDHSRVDQHAAKVEPCCAGGVFLSSGSTEDAMCHYRGSYVSDDKAKADRQKELETKRTQAVDKLKHDADAAARRAASTPAKEPASAK